jgi:hypothetical protein
MPWDVEGTDQFAEWYRGLADEDQEAIDAAVELLEELGPALRRPIVGEIQDSSLHNMKELRPPGETIRILFIFDPRRTAILLLGGDKRGEWDNWYRRAIPQAERLYEEHLEELLKEGELR